MVIPPEDPQALADAIVGVAEMPIEERREMGMRGRRFVEEYHNVAKVSVQLESLMVRTMESYRASRLHNKSITK
jgi:glycosyltransferase involved in cell wall biosynthesis